MEFIEQILLACGSSYTLAGLLLFANILQTAIIIENKYAVKWKKYFSVFVSFMWIVFVLVSYFDSSFSINGFFNFIGASITAVLVGLDPDSLASKTINAIRK